MTPAGVTRSRDRHESPRADGQTIDRDDLLGRWLNFEAEPTGLARIEVAEDGEGLSVHVHGSGPDGLSDWGDATAHPFADDVAGAAAVAFTTSYEHGFQRVELFGYLNRGVLAVDAATSFADGSGRSPYLTRALFYRP